MISDGELVLRLAAAAGLGSVIGFERERLVWAAGLRTHMLVCVGACLAMIVSAFGFADALGPRVVLDPSRVAAQVVSGVGFLGAGSIILRNEMVKGLTTAASLWAVASIGLAIGGGLYVAAAAATIIILIILAGIKPLEERYRRSRQNVEIRLQVRKGELSMTLLEQGLGPRNDRLSQFVIRPADDADLDDVILRLARIGPGEVDQVVAGLKELACVVSIGQPQLGRGRRADD